jgi:hypothetical protein
MDQTGRLERPTAFAGRELTMRDRAKLAIDGRNELVERIAPRASRRSRNVVRKSAGVSFT